MQIRSTVSDSTRKMLTNQVQLEMLEKKSESLKCKTKFISRACPPVQLKRNRALATDVLAKLQTENHHRFGDCLFDCVHCGAHCHPLMIDNSIIIHSDSHRNQSKSSQRSAKIKWVISTFFYLRFLFFLPPPPSCFFCGSVLWTALRSQISGKSSAEIF